MSNKILIIIIFIAVIITIIGYVYELNQTIKRSVLIDCISPNISRFKATNKMILTKEDALEIFIELKVPGYKRYTTNDINESKIIYNNNTIMVWLLKPGPIAIDKEGYVYYQASSCN